MSEDKCDACRFQLREVVEYESRMIKEGTICHECWSEEQKVKSLRDIARQLKQIKRKVKQ